MKTQTLNPSDFKDYGFENRPRYMNLKVYNNNVKEVTGVFVTETGNRYVVKNTI